MTTLSNLPATSWHRRSALATVIVLIAALAVTAPFADLALPRLNAFIPTLEATIFINALITAVLLFAQYSIIPSRALLALASGYLFTALIVIPHALTFPGAFAPSGLLGAGLQTSGWLYIFWHLGASAAVLAYACLKESQRAPNTKFGLPPFGISWSVAIVVGLVCGLTVLTTLGQRFLPPVIADPTHLSRIPLHYVNAVILSVGALALAVLWTRRHSVLDYWLVVVVCALISEQALVALLSGTRFSLGFYAGRAFSLITSTIVLAVLLQESTRLYARLARSNQMLEAERDSKLMNVEAITASIAHEVRQPLAAIATNGGAALRFLKRTPPDLEDVRSALNAMVSECHRASEVFDGIRALFRAPDHNYQPVDVNRMILELLRTMAEELRSHRVITRSELTSELPLIEGNRSQLQQVVVNLIHNAIEAMDGVTDRKRRIWVKTDHRGHDAIVVSVRDSGPGIDPIQIGSIFDAFVTTKSNGMGLGLAICRMIIERHGGRLTASSDGGNGALFQFVLPVSHAEADAAN